MPSQVAHLARFTLGFALDSGALARGEDGLPVEFRLFKAGENETSKGVFLFDAKAADLVMAAARDRAVDYQIDLEHLALDTESRAFDPDARGWFQLDVRNGELWAVNVKWTPDGARRLSEKTQRYISPAFLADEERRVIEIINIALCAMPATHGAPALVAATGRQPRMKTLKDRKNELAARLSIAKGKLATLAEDGGDAAPSGKFASIKSAALAAAEALAEIENAAGDVDAAMAAVDAAVAAVKAFEEAVSAMAGGSSEPAPASEPAPEAMAETPKEDEEKKQLSRLQAEVIALRAEKRRREEEEQVAKLAAEMTERSELEAKLVKTGRETPASVKLLSALPIAVLRERVKLFEGTPSLLSGPRPPADFTAGSDGSKTFQTSRGPVTLSANQLRECERAGAKPEAFAEIQASRIKR